MSEIYVPKSIERVIAVMIWIYRWLCQYQKVHVANFDWKENSGGGEPDSKDNRLDIVYFLQIGRASCRERV